MVGALRQVRPCPGLLPLPAGTIHAGRRSDQRPRWPEARTAVGPEHRLKMRVAALLRGWEPPLWWLKVHGGPWQRRGVPDFIVCVRGRFLAIELKAPGRKPTPAQAVELARLQAAGAAVLVATMVAEVGTALRAVP